LQSKCPKITPSVVVPQVINVGSGQLRVVGADTGIPQQVYRIVGADPNTPSRSAVLFQSGAAAPLPLQQLQPSESGSERILLSPDAVPRVVSYRIHPVRSEMDFSRPAAVYSSECHAPVNQYHGVSGTCPPSNASSWRATGDNDEYDSTHSWSNYFQASHENK